MNRLILIVFAIGAFPTLCSRGQELTSMSANKYPIHSCQSTEIVSEANAQISALAGRSMRLRGDDEKTGCCCLLKDSGPPPVWDCSGYVDGTLVTRAQCKKNADDLVVKFKWHEGKCTDKD